MTMDKDTQIRISASMNRAANIVATLSTGKTLENLAKDVAVLGKLIYEAETKLNLDVATAEARKKEIRDKSNESRDEFPNDYQQEIL